MASQGPEEERRNRTRNEEDLAKNVVWKVMGSKGEKRLVKGLDRERDKGGSWRGGRGGEGAPNLNLLPPRQGGEAQWTPGGRGRGVRGGGGAVRGRGGMGEREELLDLVREEVAGEGTRRTTQLNSNKRNREGEETEEERQRQPPPQLTPARQETQHQQLELPQGVL